MKVFEFTRKTLAPIRHFDSTGSYSRQLAGGNDGLAVHCVHFEPGGEIGTHPTGRQQLFLVVEGNGWVVGADGVKRDLTPGQGAFFARNESHSKGSTSGMVAIMIQSDGFRLPGAETEAG